MKKTFILLVLSVFIMKGAAQEIHYDFSVFGWYRIVVGIVVLAYFAYKGTLF